MSNGPICPSTLVGIKRYAKTIKSAHGLTHARALDAAAVAGGYQNFTQARRQLRDPAGPAPPAHLAYISVMWRERETKGSGQEILSVSLRSPLNDLVKPHHLKAARHFGAFKFAAPDHLAHDIVVSSQSDARRRACAAARTLAFMQATSLRPSKGHSRAYPGGDSRKAVPGHDHASVWFDLATKAYVYADEPYGPAVKRRIAERQAWADEHDWVIVRSKWAGMYNPEGGCELYLATDKVKGFDLAAAAEALNALPIPFVERDWDGRSEPMFPPFFSPAANIAVAARGLAPKPPAKRGQNATVGYRMVLMHNERRRPAVRMPVEGHKEVGRLLKLAIRDLSDRKRIYKPLNSVRSDLDDWVQCEYSRTELSDAVFFDLYYHEHALPEDTLTGGARTECHIANLTEAKRILASHYPDCAPLRSMLQTIDNAATALQS
ncbi:hypothetical protein BH10PSE6_BH10PSE6_09090 [soil metagenome]